VLPLRDENPTSRYPIVTIALILVCVAVYFLAQAGLNGDETVQTADGDFRIDSELRFNLELAAIPCEIAEGRPLTVEEIADTYGSENGGGIGNDAACDETSPGSSLFPHKLVHLAVVSSMFLHGGLAHLGFNMLFLWIFGNNIEDRLGHVLFFGFYVAGGIVATAGHIAVQSTSTIAIVGASGAVAGVMGAYLVWFPDAPIRTLVFLIVVDIEAKWFLAAWFLLQFFTASNSGVAWVSHVAGFMYGVTLGLLARRRTWDKTGGVGHGPYPHPGEILNH
jgi:membrane associated rhomboid family serine protease